MQVGATSAEITGQLVAVFGMAAGLGGAIALGDDHLKELFLGTVGGASVAWGTSHVLAKRSGVPITRWLVDSQEAVRAISHVRVTPFPVRAGVGGAALALTGAVLGVGFGASVVASDDPPT
jgi:hypothetical protein